MGSGDVTLGYLKSHFPNQLAGQDKWDVDITGGTITGVDITSLGTPLPIASGGTGQVTATAAINALVPSQSGQSGKALKTDGSAVAWGDDSAGITQLTGDIAAGPGTGSQVATLPTVNGNVGSFGSSTSIPSLTVNAKGQVTAASGNSVVAPAGTLTGTTLAATVVTSSLTSVGTLTGGATGAGFTVALGTSTITGDLPLSNLTQGTARSVLGVTGNSTADNASIQGTANQALVINSGGTALAFGQVNLASSAAVTGTLPVGNGGTAVASSGSSGNLLTSNGSTWTSATPSFVKTVTKQIFTGSGTYTPTAGMLFCIAEVVGAGGGGGGASNGTAYSTGAGGGAGAYGRSVITAATIGASQSVTIGAAGAGGASSGATGATGGTSSLGALISCTGGVGGAGSTADTQTPAGGAGGTSSSADINITGQTGSYGYRPGSTQSISGAGASGQYGAGGGNIGRASSGTTATAAGVNATGFGAGGGGCNVGAGASQAGGNGTAGIVFITEYCNQ